MNSKILKTHLERHAVVYLRQSTPQQVESNRESTERQYALANRAQFLGWDASLIQILDGDLGKSGQTTTGRDDFHRLMAAVGLVVKVRNKPAALCAGICSSHNGSVGL